MQNTLKTLFGLAVASLATASITQAATIYCPENGLPTDDGWTDAFTQTNHTETIVNPDGIAGNGDEYLDLDASGANSKVMYEMATPNLDEGWQLCASIRFNDGEQLATLSIDDGRTGGGNSWFLIALGPNSAGVIQEFDGSPNILDGTGLPVLNTLDPTAFHEVCIAHTGLGGDGIFNTADDTVGFFFDGVYQYDLTARATTVLSGSISFGKDFSSGSGSADWGKITLTVPEPSVPVVLGMGSLLLGLRRRR